MVKLKRGNYARRSALLVDLYRQYSARPGIDDKVYIARVMEIIIQTR